MGGDDLVLLFLDIGAEMEPWSCLMIVSVLVRSVAIQM